MQICFLEFVDGSTDEAYFHLHKKDCQWKSAVAVPSCRTIKTKSVRPLGWLLEGTAFAVRGH